jgi:hypothetical protein
MPRLGKRHFSYTKAGYEAHAKAKKLAEKKKKAVKKKKKVVKKKKK